MRTIRIPIFAFLFAGIIFLAAVYVALSDVPNKGLTALFLLPLAFAITIIVFFKEYLYCKESFGLVILYASAFVRYVITPLLIVLSNSTVSTITAREQDYIYSIIVELFELFVTMISIKFLWPKHINKRKELISHYEYDYEKTVFKLSWSGFLFVVMLIVLVLVRGHLFNVISHLSTWFYRNDTHEDLYNYDMMAFHLVKTVVFLLFVSAMRKLYDKSTIKSIPVFLALIAGLLNTMVFEYRERTDLAVLVIASFFSLSFTFPKSRKLLFSVFGIGGVMLVAMIFMEGTLKYIIGSSLSTVNLANYSKIAELYTTGPSIIANAHMNYESMRSQVTFMSFAKEIVKCCDLFSTIPFLRFVLFAVNSGKTSTEIYVSSINGLAYIIPNNTLASLYVGDVLCWIFEPILIVLNVKLLGWFERLIYKINDTMQVYAVFSIVTMVAMGIFCNNFTLMLHSFSSLPLWLLLFSYINNLGKKHKILKK